MAKDDSKIRCDSAEKVRHAFQEGAEEESEPRSTTFYAMTKKYAEKIFWRANNHKAKKIRTMFIRSVNVTGVGQVSAVIPLFITNLMNNEPIYYNSDSPEKTMYRTFIDVEDQTNIVYKLFKKIEKESSEDSDDSPKKWNEYVRDRVFHIGNYDATLGIKDIGDYLIDKYFNNGLMFWRPKQQAEEDVLGLNYDKLIDLKISSTVKTIECTIEDMVKYWSNPPRVNIPNEKIFNYGINVLPNFSGPLKIAEGRKICIVTGASGFIAPHLASLLVKDNNNFVVCIGRTLGKPYPKQPYPVALSKALEKENCIFVNLNLRDFNSLKHLFKKFPPSRVFHLAARAHVMDCQNNQEEAIKDNIDVCRNITNPDLYPKPKSENKPLLLLYSTDHLFSLSYNDYRRKIGEQAL